MMIKVNRLNGKPFFLNAEMIETIESKPDTMIALFNGRKYIVRETKEEVVEKVIAYKRSAYRLTETLSKYCKEKNEELEAKNE